jgi:hypothetical protein
MLKTHEGDTMRYANDLFLTGLLIIMLMGLVFCDWKSHTEPRINVDNTKIRGDAIYVNESPIYPNGLSAIFVNENDTLDLVMTTDLLQKPEYVLTAENNKVIQIIPDAEDPAHFYAVALGDSGMFTTLEIMDAGNDAQKELVVQIVKHWADPGNFLFINSLNGHYYYLSTNLKGWVEAKHICEDAGGYLTVINSAEENELLDEGRGMIENVWIGLQFNRIGTGENDWELKYWVNGDSLVYENFSTKPTKPDIFAEYYFHMDLNGKWENWHEISYNYFLEME